MTVCPRSFIITPKMEDNQDQESGTPSKLRVAPLVLAWELGYTIAIPIVGLALLGRVADSYFNTSPILLLVGIFLSILTSSYLIYKKVVNILNSKF